MTNSIKSLWPSQIRPRILSPLTILKTQAEGLESQTRGMLLADISQKELKNKTLLNFDIIVPALDNYRHRIMKVGYAKDMPYPALVESEIFTYLRSFDVFLETGFLGGRGASKPENRADDDEEFLELVRKTLNSPPVISAAQSLIARATDVVNEEMQNAQPVLASSSETSSSDPANHHENADQVEE